MNRIKFCRQSNSIAWDLGFTQGIIDYDSFSFIIKFFGKSFVRVKIPKNWRIESPYYIK